MSPTFATSAQATDPVRNGTKIPWNKSARRSLRESSWSRRFARLASGKGGREAARRQRVDRVLLGEAGAASRLIAMTSISAR
jgi:hypothetical protein